MYQELLETAIEAASAGAEALDPFFRAQGLAVGLKSQNDLVSEADHASEAAIIAVIRQRYPDHRILAEEGGTSGHDESHQWILDPLDGTANFVRGLPIYAVSVACRQGDRLVVGVVNDPQGGNVWSAADGLGAEWNGKPMRVSERQGLAGAFLATGFPFKAHAALDLFTDVFRALFPRVAAIRRCGAAALDLAYTAAGVYDGFFEFRLAPWDVAAGAVLMREAGGKVSDLDGGQNYLASGNIVAGAAGVHAELRALLTRHASEAELERLVPVRAAASAALGLEVAVNPT